MTAHKFLPHLALISMLVIPGVMMYRQTDPFTSMTLELNTAGSICVQWKTAVPYKNSRFEVERTTNQIKWTTVDRVASQATTQYSYLDGNPETGVNYYRIKLIDGPTAWYSNIQTIEIGDVKDCYIWPQPANQVLHVKVSFSYGTLEIIDASGRTAQKRSVTGFLTNVPTGQLPSGIYFIRIKSHDKVWLKKFVKQ